MKPESPVIELYCSDEYGGLPALRRELRKALVQLERPPCWNEYYKGWSNVPSHLKNAAYPALFVNYKMVWSHAGDKDTAPSAEMFKDILLQPPKIKRTIKWKQVIKTNASFLMAVIIAFFPKCPFCWAAYMSMFSFLGLNTISYQPWLLPLFIVLFFANLVSLYFNRKHHGYKLLLLSLAGALLIVMNRLYWNVPVIVYCGAALLVTASLWNSLSGRMVNSIRSYFLKSWSLGH